LVNSIVLRASWSGKRFILTSRDERPFADFRLKSEEDLTGMTRDELLVYEAQFVQFCKIASLREFEVSEKIDHHKRLIDLVRASS